MFLNLSRTRILLVVIGVAAAIAYTWIFHDVFTSRVPGANDFFSRWAGARLYYTKGWNPYGDETSLWIQEAIYGHAAGPGQDPSLFAYPFYTVFLVAPYALTSDYSWAQAAWQVTLQLVMFATLALILKYHSWRPSPMLLGLIVLWTILFYPTARSILLGQIGVIVFALTILVAWLTFRVLPTQSSTNKAVWLSKDGVAGLLLAVTTVKPQMQFLIIPFVLITAFLIKRRTIVFSFFISMTILFAVSFLLLPSWFADWLNQVLNYPGYTPPAVLYILTHELIPLGSVAETVERVLDLLLLGYLIFEWVIYWKRPDDPHATWVIGLTFVITHLIAPRTATTHFIVFLFSLLLLFRDWFRRGWPGIAAIVALMLILVVGLWWLFVATLAGNQESDLVHLPLPLFMFVVTLLTRPALTSQKAASA